MTPKKKTKKKAAARGRGRPSKHGVAMERITIRLTPTLLDAIDERAERDETSANDVIERAVERLLKVKS